MRGRLFLDHTLLACLRRVSLHYFSLAGAASTMQGEQRCDAAGDPFTKSPRATSRAPSPTARIRRGPLPRPKRPWAPSCSSPGRAARTVTVVQPGLQRATGGYRPAAARRPGRLPGAGRAAAPPRAAPPPSSSSRRYVPGRIGTLPWGASLFVSLKSCSSVGSGRVV